MKSHLVNKLLQAYSDRFVSQWLILLMDLTIVFMAFYVANMMRYDFVVTSINILSIFIQSILAVTLYLFAFLFTKSYRSIIRHSGINDTVRLFKAIRSIWWVVATAPATLILPKNTFKCFGLFLL